MFLWILDNYPNINFTWLILKVCNNSKIYRNIVKNGLGFAQFLWPYNRFFSIDHYLIHFYIFVWKQLYKKSPSPGSQESFVFLLPSEAMRATYFFHLIMRIKFMLTFLFLFCGQDTRTQKRGWKTWKL